MLKPDQPTLYPDDLVLTFQRRDGRPVFVRTIATDAAPPGEPDDEPVQLEDNAHSPDFSVVKWNGQTYALTPKQSKVVAILWRAMEDDVHCVQGETLIEESDSDCARVADLFKRSAAWGTLVVRGLPLGGPAGSFRLSPRA